MRALLLALGMGAIVVACGDPFGSNEGDGGSGGAAAAGGTTRTGQGGGGAADGGMGGQHTGGQHAGGQGGSVVGQPCSWTHGTQPCGEGFYCDAPECDSGHCAARESVGTVEFLPVCGCDGVTYWNASLARARGMPVADDHECTNGPSCGSEGVCPPGQGTTCGVDVLSAMGCPSSPPLGTCWNLPPQCPDTGPSTVDCAGYCMHLCTAILTGEPYYEDDSCVF